MAPKPNQKKQDSLFQKTNNSELLGLGKIPPQAIELEEAIIGACMVDAESFDRISGFMRPEMFYKQVHQTIYEAIDDLSSKRQSVDLLTVSQYLREKNQLEEIGGPIYLAQLTSKVGSGAHAEYHAKIIYQMFVMREIIRSTSELQNSAFSDSFDEMIENYASFTLKVDDLIAQKRTDKLLREIMIAHSKEMDRREKASENGNMPGIPTGFADLNLKTAGWQNGDLIVIAARPGMGKTAVSLHVGKHAAKLDHKVCFFSIEMDELRLADRLICSEGGINSDNLKIGKLTPDEKHAYSNASKKLSTYKMWIDDNSKVTINSIRSITRTKHRRGECSMIIIDYLQLIESLDRRDFNREREVAEMSRSLKLLAKELQIPIILLCQLNRAAESRQDKRPSMSDLRESGAIEQDADVILFPYRPEYYGFKEDNDGNSLEGVGILILAKNRQGAVGDIFFRYSPDLSRIYDFDKPF